LIQEIGQCHRLVRTALNQLTRRWALSDTEFLVLWLCGRARPNGIAQNDLAAAVGASAARMSGLVEQLRHRDLLVSKRSSQDRRRQLWQPTSRGLRTIDAVCAELARVGSDTDSGVSLPDRRSLIDLLRHLTRTIDRPEFLAFCQNGLPEGDTRMEAHHEQARRRAG
jgi:DNA-binding MarR family transcriptional regulator